MKRCSPGFSPRTRRSSGYGFVEVVLLDDDVRPQRFEQLFLREQLARAFYEVEQRVEQSRSQRDRLAVDAEQDAPLGIESEALEFVNRLPNGVVHDAILHALREPSLTSERILRCGVTG